MFGSTNAVGRLQATKSDIEYIWGNLTEPDSPQQNQIAPPSTVSKKVPRKHKPQATISMIPYDAVDSKLRVIDPRCLGPWKPVFRQKENTFVHGIFKINFYIESAPSNFIVKLKNRLTSMQRFYEDILDQRKLRDVKVDVYIYGDLQAYDQALKRDNVNELYAGVYRGFNGKIILRHRNDERTLKVLAHELNHAMGDSQIGDMNKWINEGLSEAFEHLNDDNPDVLVSKRSQYTSNEGEIEYNTLDVFELLGSNVYWNKGAYEDDIELYASSWLFMQFLLDSQKGRDFLKTILQKEQKHTCSSLTEQQIKELIQEHYLEIETDYNDWKWNKYGYL